MLASSEDLITVSFEKEENIESFENILRPTIIISWLLSAGISRPLKSPKFITILLRLINFGVCTTIVVFGAIDFWYFGIVFKSDTFKIIYYFNKGVCYISSYYYVLHGIIHYSKWKILIEKIGNIDKKMKQSGFKNDNKSIKKFQAFTLLATFSLGPFSAICHALYYLYYFPEDLFASDLLLYHTITQSLAVNFGYALLAFGIYTRLRVINRGILKIGDKFTPAMIINELQRAREIHHGSLIQIIININ